ncbi:hypothetical protein [Shewanella algae]|uniref:hypothetical protein n=1 Tax=Shewanella algae TaxID=38313 RepID=UPI001AAD8E60|nr:hypothetical protein [Shewanella algae]MBO2558972.1 hypothetical protein [Shewanella algae]MBO2575875.1 hypothetical protein [Shewanella algae]
MRNLKYFWIKRLNIFWGFLAVVPLPALTYAWLTGKFALHTNSEMLNTWSSPGFLSFPIAISFILFVAGSIALLYVLLKCDIDDVLPQKQ